MYINSPGGVVTSPASRSTTPCNTSRSPVDHALPGHGGVDGLVPADGRPEGPADRAAELNGSCSHQPSGGFSGKAQDIRRHAEDIIKTKRRLNEIFTPKHTGPADRRWSRETLDRDHFMSAEEARAWGIVDKVCAGRA